MTNDEVNKINLKIERQAIKILKRNGVTDDVEETFINIFQIHNFIREYWWLYVRYYAYFKRPTNDKERFVLDYCDIELSYFILTELKNKTELNGGLYYTKSRLLMSISNICANYKWFCERKKYKRNLDRILSVVSGMKFEQ